MRTQAGGDGKEEKPAGFISWNLHIAAAFHLSTLVASLVRPKYPTLRPLKRISSLAAVSMPPGSPGCEWPREGGRGGGAGGA